MVGMHGTICLGDFSPYISHQRNGDGSDTTFIYWSISPGIVGELRIDRDANDLYITFAKLFYPMRMSENFRGAYKGKIQRIKKQHGVFSGDSGAKVKRVINCSVGHNSGFGKIGGEMRDKYSHKSSPV